MVSKSHLTAVVLGMLLGGALMSMLNSGSNARPSRVVAPVDAPPTTSSGANGTLSVSVITPIPQSVATDAPTATPVPSSAPVSYKITRDDPTTQRCWDGPYGFGRTPKLSLESTTSTATNADVPRADVTTARHIEWMTQPSTFYAAFYSHVKEPSAQQRVFAVPHPKQRLGIVFIEARPHPWIVGSLRNVAHIYGGKDVSLYIFTSMEAMPFMKYHFGDWKNVQYIYAPVTLTWECHGLWLTNHEFYQYFKGGPSHILMTQKDVLMRVEVSDDVFEYPYVGAPWARLPFHQCQPPWVGNGGYSLRHVESMLQLTTNVTRADGLPEDVWFCWAIGAANMKRCPAALASHFGTEQIWNPQSTGAHAIYRDQPLGYVAEYMAQLTSFTTEEFVNGLKSFRNALQNLPKDPPVTRGNVRRSTAQPRAIPRRRPGLNS